MLVCSTDMQYVDIVQVSSEQYLRLGDVLICMANGFRSYLVGKFWSILSQGRLSDYDIWRIHGLLIDRYRASR